MPVFVPGFGFAAITFLFTGHDAAITMNSVEYRKTQY